MIALIVLTRFLTKILYVLEDCIQCSVVSESENGWIAVHLISRLFTRYCARSVLINAAISSAQNGNEIGVVEV